MARDAELLRDSRLLWIDDEPSSTRTERSALTALGVVIDTATSDDDAERRMAAEHYDIVISDIARGDRNNAGMAFVPTIREYDEAAPIIFYIRNMAPDLGTPAGALGLQTDRTSCSIRYSTRCSAAGSEGAGSGSG